MHEEGDKDLQSKLLHRYRQDPQQGKWSNLFQKTRSQASRGNKLNSVSLEVREGVPIAKLVDDDVHKSVREWDRVVVLFVACVKPLLFHVQRYVRAQWPQLISPQIIGHRDDYLLVKGSNAEDVNLMLQEGSYSMGEGRPIIIKKWTREFDFQ